MAYLGLTPSEHSSRSSVRRGGITKAGSSLARRALIEGAWSYRMQARVGRKMFDRLETLPQAVRDIAWKGQLRMCHRHRHLIAAGKPKVVVTTAIAREMLGFMRDRPLADVEPNPFDPPKRPDQLASDISALGRIETVAIVDLATCTGLAPMVAEPAGQVNSTTAQPVIPSTCTKS